MFTNVVEFEANNGMNDQSADVLSLALALAPILAADSQNSNNPRESHESHAQYHAPEALELNNQLYADDLDAYEHIHDQSPSVKNNKSNPESADEAPGSKSYRMVKRSNFQFTYDSDNHLLDSIYRHRYELFTRGNTTKTWGSVLDEFNARFDSKIIQTRTINNRFKTLRRNLEKKLIREQNPVSELNLNENENLLVNLNEYLNKKKKPSRVSKTPSADSISGASAMNVTRESSSSIKPENPAVLKSESIPLTPNQGHSAVPENSTPFAQDQKFVHMTGDTGYSHQETLDNQIDPILTSNNAYYSQTTPILHSSTHPKSTNINLVSPPNMTNLFYTSNAPHQPQLPQSGPLPQSMINTYSTGGTSPMNLSHRKFSTESPHGQHFEIPIPKKPIPLHPYSEEYGPRKRFRSAPMNTGSTLWIEELWTSQNELTSQVGELRKEMQLFREDVDSKLRNMLNNIFHNNEGISIKINNLYDVLASKEELEMKLDKVSKVLDMDHNQFQNQPLQQHIQNLTIHSAPNNPDVNYRHP